MAIIITISNLKLALWWQQTTEEKIGHKLPRSLIGKHHSTAMLFIIENWININR